MSAFGGAAIPFETDLKGTNPTIAQNVTAQDVELETSAAVGGKFGRWATGLRPNTGADSGVELDVTHFSPDIKRQRVSATGSVGGLRVVGVTVNDFDMPCLRQLTFGAESDIKRVPVDWLDLLREMGLSPLAHAHIVITYLPNKDKDGKEFDVGPWETEALKVQGRLFRGATSYPSRGSYRQSDETGESRMKAS